VGEGVQITPVARLPERGQAMVQYLRTVGEIGPSTHLRHPSGALLRRYGPVQYGGSVDAVSTMRRVSSRRYRYPDCHPFQCTIYHLPLRLRQCIRELARQCARWQARDPDRGGDTIGVGWERGVTCPTGWKRRRRTPLAALRSVLPMGLPSS
jgi:hypothetical protein